MEKGRNKMSSSRIGINLAEKNGNWSGDKIGLNGLHRWVGKRLPKPDFCNMCEKNPPFDLANRGEYTRDLKNWEWLCRSCHMESDGRMKNIRHSKEWYKGENNPNAKLTQRQVDQIRIDRKSGMKFKDIAKKHNTTIDSVKKIIYKKSWVDSDSCSTCEDTLVVTDYVHDEDTKSYREEGTLPCPDCQLELE